MAKRFQIDTNNTLMTNLIAHWKLNETPTVTRGGLWKETINPGRGPSVQFISSNNEYLSIADNSDLSTGDIDFFYATWVYLDSKSSDKGISGKGSTSGGTLEWYLYYDNSSDRFNFSISSDGSSVAVSVNADNLGSPSTETWYFISIWHDATANTINIKINNSTTDSTATSGSTPSDRAGAFEIGRIEESNYFDGRIALTGFWKKVLSTDEIKQLYNNGNGLHSKELHGTLYDDNLVSYWNLNESHRTRYDSYGTNHLTDNNTTDFAEGVTGGNNLGEQGLGEGTVELATGVIHTAPRFTGINSADRIALVCPSNSDLQTGDIDFTVAGWVNLNSLRDSTMIAKGNRTLAREFAVRIATDGSIEFHIGDGSSGTNGIISSSSTLSIDTLYFIVCWHDSVSNTVNIQINNGTIDSNSTTGVGVATNERLCIGCFVQGSNLDVIHNIDGIVDNVFYWKKILTSQEKTDLYNSGLGNTIINPATQALAFIN